MQRVIPAFEYRAVFSEKLTNLEKADSSEYPTQLRFMPINLGVSQHLPDSPGSGKLR
jgi:hypothetical protein